MSTKLKFAMQAPNEPGTWRIGASATRSLFDWAKGFRMLDPKRKPAESRGAWIQRLATFVTQQATRDGYTMPRFFLYREPKHVRMNRSKFSATLEDAGFKRRKKLRVVPQTGNARPERVLFWTPPPVLPTWDRAPQTTEMAAEMAAAWHNPERTDQP